MANERNTENLVRDSLRKLGYYDDSSIIIEEQKSAAPDIDKLLKNASKKGAGNGHPEFIIRSKSNSGFVIVIECKAQNRFHQSENRNKYADYAVDGALLYGTFLNREYDVLAIGVSGETRTNLKVTHLISPKGMAKFGELFGGKFLSFADYYEGFKESDLKFSQDYSALLEYAKSLNATLQSNKIKESQRSILISGILIALGNESFKKGYASHKKAEQISTNLLNTVSNEFSDAEIPVEKIKKIEQAFSFIKTNTTLTTDREFFVNLIKGIDTNINAFMKTYKYFDTVGQFYIEFLRYANNDKGLGIVLTPPHITELFSDLAFVDKDSVVFDNCCGTGGFLISAMKRMIEDAKGDKKKILSIKKKQLYGIEFQDDIGALGMSNMIVHGDGKTNFHIGSCFDLSQEMKQFKPNVGFLNPPYKSEPENPEEFEFVLNNLNTLVKGGKCISIIPISCLISKQPVAVELRSKILEKHTLEAVMSMPEDLFHNSKVNVHTCIVVITAHIPHPKGKKTWLGYWRNDGFRKHKTQGRIDLNGTWPEIKTGWLSAYVNREQIKGISLTRELAASDEWAPELYMKADYSQIDEASYLRNAKQYLSFRLLNDFLDVNFAKIKKPVALSHKKLVPLISLFHIHSGVSKSKVAVKAEVELDYDIMFIRPSKTYQGSIDGFVDESTVAETDVYQDNTVYVSSDGQGSHTYSYLSSFKFVPNSNVVALIPKRDMSIQEKLYYSSCITLNRFKFSYGRKPKGDRLENLLIPECPPDFVYKDIFSKIFEDWKKLVKN